MRFLHFFYLCSKKRLQFWDKSYYPGSIVYLSCFCPKIYFLPKMIFWHWNIIWPKIFYRRFYVTKNFFIKIFFSQIFFRPKNVLLKYFLSNKFLLFLLLTLLSKTCLKRGAPPCQKDNSLSHYRHLEGGTRHPNQRKFSEKVMIFCKSIKNSITQLLDPFSQLHLL